MADIDISTLGLHIDHDQAVYASVREVVSPHIVDMKIIFATDKAAELFGFRNSSEIIGSYVSMLHNPEDISNTRRWSLLRYNGQEAIDEYDVRIQRHDGIEIPVRKHVNLVSVGNIPISISEQHEIDSKLFQPLNPPPPEMINPDAMLALWGMVNVREADLFLRTYFNLTFGSYMDNIIPNVDSEMPKTVVNEAIEKLNLNSDAEYYQYKCLVCLREWIRSVRLKSGESITHPRRCKFADCRSTLWNNVAGAEYARARRNRSR